MPSVSNVLDSIIAWTNLHLHLDPIHTLLQAIRASYANWNSDVQRQRHGLGSFLEAFSKGHP